MLGDRLVSMNIFSRQTTRLIKQRKKVNRLSIKLYCQLMIYADSYGHGWSSMQIKGGTKLFVHDINYGKE